MLITYTKWINIILIYKTRNYSQVHYVISLAFLGDLQRYTFLKTVLYLGNQKTNVSNLPDVNMSAILDF